MKTARTKINPEFKRTQPLPKLPGNMAGRIGWAAQPFTRPTGPTAESPAMGINLAQRAVRVHPGLPMPALSLAGCRG